MKSRDASPQQPLMLRAADAMRTRRDRKLWLRWPSIRIIILDRGNGQMNFGRTKPKRSIFSGETAPSRSCVIAICVASIAGWQRERQVPCGPSSCGSAPERARNGAQTRGSQPAPAHPSSKKTAGPRINQEPAAGCSHCPPSVTRKPSIQ